MFEFQFTGLSFLILIPLGSTPNSQWISFLAGKVQVIHSWSCVLVTLKKLISRIFSLVQRTTKFRKNRNFLCTKSEFFGGTKGDSFFLLPTSLYIFLFREFFRARLRELTHIGRRYTKQRSEAMLRWCVNFFFLSFSSTHNLFPRVQAP